MAVFRVVVDGKEFYSGKSDSGYRTRLLSREDAIAELKWLDRKWGEIRELWQIRATEDEDLWRVELEENMEAVMKAFSYGLRPFRKFNLPRRVRVWRGEGPGEGPEFHCHSSSKAFYLGG